MTDSTFEVIKILGISAVATMVALLWSPMLIRFLYEKKLWKKTAGKVAISGEQAVVFNALHKEKDTGTPRMGGLVIWVTTAAVALIFYIISLVLPNTNAAHFNFLTRSETWLPLFMLIAAALFGLLDDILTVSALGKYVGGGLSFKKRLVVVALMGLMAGLWFYYKLGWDVIGIPLVGEFSIGFWYIPLFVIVTVACWSGGIIDGIDGLSGGAFASMFGAFGIIAFSQGKADLATFCTVICGTLFAFLWFNIPPARFYMTETGSMALSMTLAVVAFLTDSVFVLPIIAGLMVLEVGSVIIQLLSKKIRKKKIFLSTPIHHHFEAIGWPAYKVVMRAWVVGIVLAIVGVTIKLVG